MFIGIIALAEGCKRLIEINLSGCPLVSDDSVQALAENCDNLRSVNLAYTNITDEGAYYLAYGACGPKLQVGLFYCSHRLSSHPTFSFLLSLRFSYWRPLNTACGQDGGGLDQNLPIGSAICHLLGVFLTSCTYIAKCIKVGCFQKSPTESGWGGVIWLLLRLF